MIVSYLGNSSGI